MKDFPKPVQPAALRPDIDPKLLDQIDKKDGGKERVHENARRFCSYLAISASYRNVSEMSSRPFSRHSR